jgi:site-specific recombinase XerD
MADRQTLSILFYLRRDKENRRNEVPIYMRITVNGKKAEIATNRYIDHERWNPEGGFVKGTKTEFKQLNEYLDLLRSKVYSAQRDLLEQNQPVTALGLKNNVQGTTNAQRTVLEVFRYHNKMMKERIPEDNSPSTLIRYETTLNHVSDFIKHKYKVEDLYLTSLNHEFITNLEHYLRTVRKCNHNSSIKYIKNFKKIIRLALKNDWLSKDPFFNYKASVKPVKRGFLDADEIVKLENKEFHISRLEQVRDIFIFSCYTGLAYKDVQELTPDNIRTGIDGDKWIFTERVKTSVKSHIPLLPKALQIIEKYKDWPENVIKGKLLPVISNQKMNAYLKEIAILTEINKNLTFHLARHTFATTVTLTNDVPIETVSEMLGHKSIKTTQIYAKVIDKKVSGDMGRLKERLSKEQYASKKTDTV